VCRSCGGAREGGVNGSSGNNMRHLCRDRVMEYAEGMKDKGVEKEEEEGGIVLGRVRS